MVYTCVTIVCVFAEKYSSGFRGGCSCVNLYLLPLNHRVVFRVQYTAAGCMGGMWPEKRPFINPSSLFQAIFAPQLN